MLKTIKENHIHTIKNNTLQSIKENHIHTLKKYIYYKHDKLKNIKLILIYFNRNQRGTPDHQQSQDAHQPRSADNGQLNR